VSFDGRKKKWLRLIISHYLNICFEEVEKIRKLPRLLAKIWTNYSLGKGKC